LVAGSDRWVQFYHPFNPAISLQNINIFGFDIKGTSCNDENPCHSDYTLEFKFENGPKQATFTRYGESGLLAITRWVNHLFFLKNDNDLIVQEGFNWDSITVFSIAVKSIPGSLIAKPDSGIVFIRNFVGGSTSSWAKGAKQDTLVIDQDTLQTIKNNAAQFILSRQKSTGLLTTWAEDGSSWLYGQGLALKVLSIEGIWSDGIAQNDYAIAAEKLAHFLASNQQAKGYWARSWNSVTGSVNVPYESYDSSIWMGDFPWIITGLSSYYKKSSDPEISAALLKAENFLKSLITDDGKFYTINVFNDKKIEVSSTEAYVAAIGAFYEIGDSIEALKLIHYINPAAWNTQLGYWNEGTYSDRVVLFANTWMAQILYKMGYQDKALDALSFAGKLLFTKGPGLPYGLDGIGPIAVWYEGTLSYVCAGGPGSNYLFNNIRPFINQDGSVPHYNDDIGGAGGIWAVKWSSLDGTSWLYFAASKNSPFKVLPSTLFDHSSVIQRLSFGNNIQKVYPIPNSGVLYIDFKETTNEPVNFRIIDLEGGEVLNEIKSLSKPIISIDVSALKPGAYFITIQSKSFAQTKKIIIL